MWYHVKVYLIRVSYSIQTREHWMKKPSPGGNEIVHVCLRRLPHYKSTSCLMEMCIRQADIAFMLHKSPKYGEFSNPCIMWTIRRETTPWKLMYVCYLWYRKIRILKFEKALFAYYTVFNEFSYSTTKGHYHFLNRKCCHVV